VKDWEAGDASYTCPHCGNAFADGAAYDRHRVPRSAATRRRRCIAPWKAGLVRGRAGRWEIPPSRGS